MKLFREEIVKSNVVDKAICDICGGVALHHSEESFGEGTIIRHWDCTVIISSLANGPFPFHSTKEEYHICEACLKKCIVPLMQRPPQLMPGSRDER
jgi:hypothetical protein